MTYWPISSPSVFAATKRTDLGRSLVSNDGVEDKQSGDRRAGSSPGSDSQSEENRDANNASVVEEKGDGQPSHTTAPDQQRVEDDIHGTILAVRLTRSGQLFATLTRTTLTVWQTKVLRPRLLSRY